MGPVTELTFRRATINLADAARLGEGEDLNDALLDFFMRLGQSLIPRKGEDEAPVSYLGSLFFKQLTSAFSTSGEEGWKHVQNWAKRKAGGLFKKNYAAFSVPINEDLKDDRGQPAGNHWWLALVLNPPGGARGEPIAVMCLDSMQRREKIYEEKLKGDYEGSSKRYQVEVSKVEQAGYLLIVSFNATGDGSFGPLHRPERSTLKGNGVECRNPELGLRINMGGGDNVAGRFDGTLTFALDGKIRSSTFDFFYSEGYTPIRIEFDPFMLTKLQKTVTRFLSGYIAKEWEMNGPQKTSKFEKTAARALVADVYQQENLNDCGVFVLENTLRSLSMQEGFLKTMASATPQVLKSFPWPSQQDVTNRKLKLKAITARLFECAAAGGTSNVEQLFKDNAELKKEILASLTDENNSELDKWSGDLHQALAARQVDKSAEEQRKKEKEADIQARKEEERRLKEEEEAKRKAAEEKAPPKPKIKRKHETSSEKSRSPSRRRGDEKRKKPASKKPPVKRQSTEPSRSPTVDRPRNNRSPSRKAKKPTKPSAGDKRKEKTKNGKRGRDDSRDASPAADSRSDSRGRDKKKRRR